MYILERGKKVIASLVVVSAVALLFVLTSALAASSSEAPFSVSQPSGEKFTLVQKGDEYFNYSVTEDGIVVIQKEDGYWHYATTTDFQNEGKPATKLVAMPEKYLIDSKPAQILLETDLEKYPNLWYAKQAIENSIVQPKLFNFASLEQPTQSASNFKYLGDQPILVLLVEFDDIKIRYSESSWSDKIFGTDNKSVKKYYQENSDNKINILPAVEDGGTNNDGIVKVKLNRVHPRPTGNTLSDGYQNIVTDAMDEADPYVNFAQYDKNHDGRITAGELHVMTIVAGYERSLTGSAVASVWGNKATTINSRVYDSINFFTGSFNGITYTMFGEVHKYAQVNMGIGESEYQATIGIICHELGHDFGLPDLYGSGQGYGNMEIGGFSLMGSGSYGHTKSDIYEGETPVNLDAYCKIKLGIIEPEVVDSTVYSSHNLSSSDQDDYKVLRINTSNPNEYFLIENRQFKGFDAGLSQFTYSGGILVYRVKEYPNSEGTVMAEDICVKEADEGIVGYSKIGSGYQSGYDSLYYVGMGLNKKPQQTELSMFTTPSTSLSNGTLMPFTLTVHSPSMTTMNITINDALKPIAVTDVTLNQSSKKIHINDKLNLVATVTPENATNKNVTWKSSDPSIATVDENGQVIGKALGTVTITVTTEDGQKTATCQVTVVPIDTVKPVINYPYNYSRTIKQGTALDPKAGVKATDDIDGDITSKIVVTTTLNVNTPGTYQVTYAVSDEAGNTTSTTKQIIVQAVGPMLIANSKSINQGTAYDPLAGVTATDFQGKDISSRVTYTGVFDVNVPGVYQITYSVTDDWGTTTSGVRNLTVKAVGPILIANSKSIKVGTAYDPIAGVTATDFQGKDISSRVTYTGSYNVNVPGVYQITYSVTDDWGTTTSGVRSLTVTN